MSLRNILNDRYQNDDVEKTSSAPKRAASAKPKTQAAASVRFDSGKKTPEQKKAEKQEREKKETEERKKYMSPPTRRYKILTRTWAALLIIAFGSTAIVGLFQDQLPIGLATVLVFCAYAGIIAALIIDFGPRRKERDKYQALMQSHKDRDKTTKKASGKGSSEDGVEEAEAAPKKRWNPFARKKADAADEVVESAEAPADAAAKAADTAAKASDDAKAAGTESTAAE